MDPQHDDWGSPTPRAVRSSTLSRLGKPAALIAGGAVAGAVLAGTLSAGAATLTGTGGSGGSAASQQYGGPGVQENDGIPEAQEHHGEDLSLTGTVTGVGSGTVTIKTSAGATATYTVDSSSDIDKNGEAQLSNLAAGDAVRYSVRSGTTTIDKLHAGDETKDRPAAPPGADANGSAPNA